MVWLLAQGYVVKDTSKNSPFDFEAVRSDGVVKIEVKGTTAELVDSILMTRNEVELHRTEKGRTGLLIVSRIQLKVTKDGSMAAGGSVSAAVPCRFHQQAP